MVSMSGSNKSNVQAALQQARSNESGQLDASTEQTLRQELNRVWALIQNAPNSYTMDSTEFAVFNRYRAEPSFQNETARKAVERYWNNTSSTNSH